MHEGEKVTKNPCNIKKPEQKTRNDQDEDAVTALHQTLGAILADLTEANASEELKLKLLDKTNKIIKLFKLNK